MKRSVDDDDDCIGSGDQDDWLDLLSMNAQISSAREECKRQSGRSPSPSCSKKIPKLWPSVILPEEEQEEEESSEIFQMVHSFDSPGLRQMELEYEDQSRRVLHLRSPIYPLPIYFHHQNQCCSQTLRDVVNLYGGVRKFYVGATVSPMTRWLGRANCGERGHMPGHFEKWSSMWLIALAQHARSLETNLIKYAQYHFPDKCENKAADCRGQAPGTNWIYVVIR